MSSPPEMPPGVRVAVFDEIDSTMDEGRRRAGQGDTGPLWIVAGSQTKGRGRRNRAWESGKGNLFCTLLLKPGVAPAEAAKLSFLAAVCVCEMLDQYVSDRARLACKWPNDVLLDGRKAVGILLESETDGQGGLAWLSIGIGVNLAWHPDIAERPATSLSAVGITPPHPHDALALLAARFAAWLARWNAEGFAPVKQAWIGRAARMGEEIEVRLDKEALHGIFTALDDSGALVLQMPGGAVRRITAGDVFFPEV